MDHFCNLAETANPSYIVNVLSPEVTVSNWKSDCFCKFRNPRVDWDIPWRLWVLWKFSEILWNPHLGVFFIMAMLLKAHQRKIT